MGQDVGRDLVSEHRHDRRSGSDELDPLGREASRQVRVLGGVSPPGPNSVHPLLPCVMGWYAAIAIRGSKLETWRWKKCPRVHAMKGVRVICVPSVWYSNLVVFQG